MTTLCAICPAKPPRAPLPESRACGVCVADLQRMLDDLERLLPVLRSLLEPGRTIGDGRGSTGAAPAPLRVDVLSILDDKRNGPDVFLAYWAGRLDVPPTPAGLAGVLSRVVELDDLEAFTRALRDLHSRVSLVSGEPQPAKVATCRRTIRGKECRGAIIAVPGGSEAVCSVCGDQWPRARWKFLGRIEAEAG